jgi:steroid delta-isomerase-like uncharacterized protein
MNSQEVDSVVEGIAAAWNERDLDACLSHLADDVVWNDPAMQVPAVGREAVKEFSESVLRAFPDFRYTIRYPICHAADGSRCAVPWLITATHLGPLEPPGFGPTGKRAEFQGVDVLEFQGGKVKRIDTFFDVTKPAEQLLSMSRPQAGGRLERVLVRLQRIRAAWLRKRGER